MSRGNSKLQAWRSPDWEVDFPGTSFQISSSVLIVYIILDIDTGACVTCANKLAGWADHNKRDGWR